MTNIKLVGVIHTDPRIKQRTTMALEQEKPSVITVEASPGDIEFLKTEFRKQMEERLQHHKSRGLSDQASKVISIINEANGGEIYAAVAYAEKHSIPLHEIDDPKLALSAQSNEHPDTPLYQLERLSIEGIQKETDDEYARWHELCLNPDPYFEEYIVSGDTEERDTISLQQLTNITKGVDGLIVHICGIGHMLRDPKQWRTLYEKLLKLDQSSVSRTTLRAYDDRDALLKEVPKWTKKRKQVKKKLLQ